MQLSITQRGGKAGNRYLLADVPSCEHSNEDGRGPMQQLFVKKNIKGVTQVNHV